MDRPSEGAVFRRICFIPKDPNLHAGTTHLNNFFLICCNKDFIALLFARLFVHSNIVDINMQLRW